MLISSNLSEQIQAAIKSGDKTRVSVLRLLSSALRNAEVSKAGQLTEAETIAVIAREVRKREEAAAEYSKAGRGDRAAAEDAEAAILREWLPEAISPEELDRMVDESIAEAGASGPQDMGNVMKLLMPKVQGRAAGKKVSELVREKLSG
jgi:uncharacterized protein YqeY